MMKQIFVIVLMTLACSFIYAQKPREIDSVTIVNEIEEGHKIIFTIVRDKFDTANHDISRLMENIIDGRLCHGTDGDVPQTEIKYISLNIDGKEIQIDPALYRDFYNPNLGYNDGSKYVDVFWGDDYQSVFMLMNGSDGAGSYSVVWVFRKNGKHIFMKPTYDELYFNFN